MTRLRIGMMLLAVLPVAIAAGVGPQPEQVSPKKVKPAATAPAEQIQPATAASQTDLPNGKDLFAQHVKAIGGKDAILKQTNRMMEGIMELPQMGAKASIIIKRWPPNKLYVRIEEPGSAGAFEAGNDGTIGWIKPAGRDAIKLEGDQLKAQQNDAEFYSDTTYEKRFETFETIERTTYADRDAYKVHVVSKDKQSSWVYFDAENHLRLGSEIEGKAPTGETYITTITIGDYKEFGGVLFPMKMTMTQNNLQRVITFTKIQVDVPDMPPIEAPAELVEGEG